MPSTVLATARVIQTPPPEPGSSPASPDWQPVDLQAAPVPAQSGAPLAESVPPGGTLLAVVPIPGTDSSLAIVGYTVPAADSGPVPRPVDFAYIWGAALDEWRRAHPHVRIVNLETSITCSDAFEPKGINYRMSPENGPCLSAAGLDCCVLANNHVLDWGPAGLIDTLNALEKLRIKTAGAGRNLA